MGSTKWTQQLVVLWIFYPCWTSDFVMVLLYNAAASRKLRRPQKRKRLKEILTPTENSENRKAPQCAPALLHNWRRCWILLHHWDVTFESMNKHRGSGFGIGLHSRLGFINHAFRLRQWLGILIALWTSVKRIEVSQDFLYCSPIASWFFEARIGLKKLAMVLSSYSMVWSTSQFW